MPWGERCNRLGADTPPAAFCALGAIYWAGLEHGDDDATERAESRLDWVAEEVLGSPSIEHYNDGEATHPQVLEAFDLAITFAIKAEASSQGGTS